MTQLEYDDAKLEQMFYSMDKAAVFYRHFGYMNKGAILITVIMLILMAFGISTLLTVSLCVVSVVLSYLGRMYYLGKYLFFQQEIADKWGTRL